MNIEIPLNSTVASIKTAHPVPRGATHFRFTTPGRKPVIDKLANIDTLAGCSGKLEHGKARFEGRGKHAKIVGFESMATASPAHIVGTRKPTVEAAEESSPESGAPEAAAKPAKKRAKLDDASNPESKPASKARKPLIFGCSACAVAKALGRAGVKYDEADRIMRAHGITMPKSSLSVQLGFGRNEATWERHGKPAELTEAQIAELRAGVAAA